MRFTRLLLLIRAGAKNGQTENIQALRLNRDTDHLTVTLFTEARFEQSLNHSL
jgi:hypothetical protein